MSITLIFFLLILVSGMTNSAFGSETGTIVVKISGIESDKGKIIANLHNQEDAFPMESEKSLMNGESRIENGNAEIIFQKVPYGKYAIAVHHDENSNGEVDTNFIGIPSEGLAASNNAGGTFGPPSFDDASFSLNENKIVLKINMD
ncbi:MAG: DUF2141 domain-containing protein [Candidatus Kapaibacterium sp.]